MAKKKTVSKKKPSTAKKKPAPASKKTSSNRKTPSVRKTASVRETHAPQVLANNGIHQKDIALLPPEQMNGIKLNIENEMAQFKSFADNNLTSLQRRRKIGAGVRNYGFIDKVSDLATANPDYAHFFNLDDLKNCIRNIEICRDILVLLQSFARLISNTMMIYSDDAYSMALNYYNMVKEMSKQGDPTAMELYRELLPFFKRPKRTSSEPTEKELERDLHALIHGKADGKIEVISERPKASAGKRVLVDEVNRGRAAIKQTAEAEIEE
jgi:hypothetical protein